MKQKVIASFDLGGTNYRVGILSASGELLKCWKSSSRSIMDPQNVTETILQEINRFEEYSNVIAIAIGAPGLITESGIIVESPNFPNWKNLPLAALLSEKTGLFVKVENDANLFTIGEGFKGAALNAKNFVGITIGTGVGGGIIIGGKIYRGTKGMAGEIGHVVIHPSGPLCSCGRKGCIEAYSSGKAITKQMEQLTGLLLSPQEIAGLAKKGDKTAIKVFEKAGYHLGIGLASVINILDVEMVVIGGGISESMELMYKNIQKGLAEHTFESHLNTVKIVKSLLGDEAGIYGGYYLVKDFIDSSVAS